MRCPEKGLPKRLGEDYDLKEIGGSCPVSTNEYISGRRRPVAKPSHGTRTALYLRVSTADQKPDLQYDGLRSYAAHAGLDVIQEFCDVAISGRREGRPRLNGLMTAARNHEAARRRP
jgi:predicted site-specific integrase-resolvase